MSSAASVEEPSVERAEVVALVQPRRAQPAPPDPPPAPVVAPPPPRADNAFVGVLAALASLLAARLLLLLSIAGAFVLAVMAVRDGSYIGLAVLVAYCSLTLLPLVWLDVVTHRRGGK
jgi:hypothetical protein